MPFLVSQFNHYHDFILAIRGKEFFHSVLADDKEKLDVEMRGAEDRKSFELVNFSVLYSDRKL